MVGTEPLSSLADTLSQLFKEMVGCVQAGLVNGNNPSESPSAQSNELQLLPVSDLWSAFSCLVLGFAQ